MSKKCLYCYKELGNSGNGDFHEHCSLDFFGTKKEPSFPYSLKDMAGLAKNIVDRSVTVPGVQPKLSLTLINDAIKKEGNKNSLTVVGALGGNYIFKPPSEHYPEMPQNEHLTMRIAEVLGIPTVKSSLIRLESGELAYITKRIDRTENGEKIHMLDMFQILGAYDKYKNSMEKVGKAIGEYASNTQLDKLYFFELSVFCFLTGNNDMHLKNFSMINNANEWSLSPAYDLLNVAIANPDDKEELALTLEGKKKKIQLDQFERFAQSLELNTKQIKVVFRKFKKNKALVIKWVEDSFLSDKYKELYITLFEERYATLIK